MYPCAYHLVRIEPPPYEVEVGGDVLEATDGASDAGNPAPQVRIVPSTFQILNMGFLGVGWRSLPPASTSPDTTPDAPIESCV